MITYRRADTKDRCSIKNLHINNHLQTTAKNDDELIFQKSILFKDFSHLYHDDLFDKCIFWIASDSNVTIGCIGLITKIDHWLITSFSVAESYRGKGIGSSLFKLCIDFIKSQSSKLSVVKLYTLPDRSPSAYKIYQKWGFQQESIKQNGPFLLHTLSLHLPFLHTKQS